MIYFHLEVKMENQINAGNQNTQQIGGNPVSQLIQTPEKPRVNYWMISSLVFGFLFFAILSVNLLNLATAKKKNDLVIPPSQPSTTPVPTESTIKTSLTWEECIKRPGSRMLQTFPGICVTSDGQRITKPIQKPSWGDCSTNPNNKILQTDPLTCIYPDGIRVTAPVTNNAE